MQEPRLAGFCGGMAQENIEVVRRTIDLFNRNEVDRVLDTADRNLEMDWSNSIGPLRGVYRGRQEVLEFWQSFLEAWDEVRWDPQEFIEVDEARVIVVNRVRMRGRRSGADVEAIGVQLWTITDGKGRKVKLYQTKAEALEAPGLSISRETVASRARADGSVFRCSSEAVSAQPIHAARLLRGFRSNRVWQSENARPTGASGPLLEGAGPSSRRSSCGLHRSAKGSSRAAHPRSSCARP
jgi:ketosteroid isomerase-like protein